MASISTPCREFDWGQALVEPDDGHNEQRWIATGFIGLRLYVAAFTELDKGRVRVVSLRKASGREEKSYVKHVKRR